LTASKGHKISVVAVCDLLTKLIDGLILLPLLSQLATLLLLSPLTTLELDPAL